jgi:integrase
MPYRLPSHLHRNRCGILHFRIAIPADLRHHFGTAEVYRSLSTAKVTEAALPAQTLALSFKALFRQLRDGSMCATKKKPGSDDGMTIEWTTEINFDEFRRPKTVKFTSEPGDPPGAMASAIRAVLDGAPAARPIEVTSTQAVVDVSNPLSSYIEPYLRNAFTASRPDEKTLDSYRAAITLFIDIVGDKSLHELGVTDQNRFEDLIAKVPANRTKIAKARALSLDEMTSLDVPKLSPQSTKNVAMRANRFLTWAFRRQGGKPPFELMGNVRITARSKTVQRRAFTNDELRTLFSPATYFQGYQQSPYMFWVPLIGLHSGMRINEIAQLALVDIVSHDGIECFHVTDDDSDESQGRRVKRVKTDAGRRVVPIHTALVDLGLLDYLRTVRQDGHSVLFPELIGGRDGPGQPASKQFARYCDRVGLVDPGLVFHSFRHGAVGRMRAAGIAKELRMIVVGHSATDDTHDGYGDIKSDLSVADRKRAIEVLRFDNVLDYNALKALQPTLANLRDALSRIQTRVRKASKSSV